MLWLRLGHDGTTGRQLGRVPRAAPQPHVTWPIVSGAVPQLAVGHIDRPETGPGLPDSLSRGETMVLNDGDDALTRGVSGLGGTRKAPHRVAAAHPLPGGPAAALPV